MIDRTIEWQKLAATLEEVNRIRVHDVLNETYEVSVKEDEETGVETDALRWLSVLFFFSGVGWSVRSLADDKHREL